MLGLQEPRLLVCTIQLLRLAVGMPMAVEMAMRVWAGIIYIAATEVKAGFKYRSPTESRSPGYL